jgi:Rps23 Pro-64 3,4-dihydroxylase Tpa1-like proline 4-hydroxylase
VLKLGETVLTTHPQPRLEDWLGVNPLALAAGAVADAPQHLLVIDGFLQLARAEALAQTLATKVMFSPRFGRRATNHDTKPAARGTIIDAQAWAQTPASDRLFRFEAIDDLQEAANDVLTRVQLLEFWRMLASDRFRSWLETQTRCPCLSPRLEAHRMSVGDFIGPHSDARASRSVALFIYLSPEWGEADGGVLRIDNGVVSILPCFNRAVIFDVKGHAVHDLPPLPRGTGRVRLSFGVWYHACALSV